jgi:hypothetical protein
MCTPWCALFVEERSSDICGMPYQYRHKLLKLKVEVASILIEFAIAWRNCLGNEAADLDRAMCCRQLANDEERSCVVACVHVCHTFSVAETFLLYVDDQYWLL